MPEVKLRFILSGTDTSRHSGATLEFIVDDNKTVAQLKEQIRAQWPKQFEDVNIGKKKLTIIYNAQVLNDANQLTVYGNILQQTDPPVTLHLMLQPLVFEEPVPQKPATVKEDKGCPCVIL